MSKQVKTDFDFDREGFAGLLDIAKGGRTQADFARDCGISVSHMNRYLNRKKENPPTPTTIMQIAEACDNRVPYEDLMHTAGYDYLKYPMPDTPKPLSKVMRQALTSLIASALENSRFEKSEMPEEELDFQNKYSGKTYDLGVNIKGCENLKKWYIDITSFTAGGDWVSGLERAYGQLAYIPFEPDTKISFVVFSKRVFDFLKDYPPIMLSVYFSVILMDTDSGEEIIEEYLPTSLELPDDVRDIHIYSQL